MTYLQFLLLFLGIPLCLVFLLYNKSELPHKKEFRFGIMLLSFLAISYTTPWDNYLVKTGVWMYGEGRIIGTIGYVPIEEYCFFILQTILSGLTCFLLQAGIPLIKKAKPLTLDKIVIVGYILCFFVGVLCLGFDKTRYLGLILTWAMPVIVLQWFFGGSYLATNRKIFLLSIFIPTTYLWVADGLAIHWGIWGISETYTMGFSIGSLPMEEAIFFLVTNVMVAQGVILFVVMEEEMAKLRYSVRRILRWVG